MDLTCRTVVSDNCTRLNKGIFKKILVSCWSNIHIVKITTEHSKVPPPICGTPDSLKWIWLRHLWFAVSSFRLIALTVDWLNCLLMISSAGRNSRTCQWDGYWNWINWLDLPSKRLVPHCDAGVGNRLWKSPGTLTLRDCRTAEQFSSAAPNSPLGRSNMGSGILLEVVGVRCGLAYVN